MCTKHEPIIVYDSGGTQKVCKHCGKPLSKWVSNGDSKNHEKRKTTK